MKPITVRIDSNAYVLWACILFVIFIVLAVRGFDVTGSTNSSATNDPRIEMPVPESSISEATIAEVSVSGTDSKITPDQP